MVHERDSGDGDGRPGDDGRPARVPVTTGELVEHALSLGIGEVGTCRAEPYERAERAILERREAGLFADLKFTMRRPEVSCHPEGLVEEAATVVSAALSYWRPDAPETGGDAAGPRGRIGRYTRDDAYEALQERLAALAAWLDARGWRTRVLVDANQHVDREAAVRSGVGFFGKHTNVITRRLGSWVVLGTLVTDATLEPTEPMRPGCGSCTLCIDACPTDAIVDDGVLDARRCITYWTQSWNEPPPDVREAMGDWVYGCDICQEACPWNRGPERRAREAGTEPAAATVDLVDWLEAADDDLASRYERFFIPRRQVRYLRRNAIIAIGNSGRQRDAALLAPYLECGDEMLVDCTARALERLGGPLAAQALEGWRRATP